MAMLMLHGQVINVFQAPRGTNKEGEEYGGQERVQIMAQSDLKNGETRMELVNLTVTNPEAYVALQGRLVSVPVGAFASGKNVQFFVPKGAEPIDGGETCQGRS